MPFENIRVFLSLTLKFKSHLDGINSTHIMFAHEPSYDQVSLILEHFKHLSFICVSA